MGTTADKLSYLIETKNAIRDAITSMGVTIDDNTPFRDYASKILEISSDATATANDILLDKTAYSQGEKLTGTYNVMTEDIPEVGGTIEETSDLADNILGETADDILGEN